MATLGQRAGAAHSCIADSGATLRAAMPRQPQRSNRTALPRARRLALCIALCAARPRRQLHARGAANRRLDQPVRRPTRARARGSGTDTETVSWLSADPEESLFATAAARHPLNYGTAEELLRFHPDVVIAGAYTNSFTRALLIRLGYRVVELTPEDDRSGDREQSAQCSEHRGPSRARRAACRHDPRPSRVCSTPTAPRARWPPWW